MNSMLRSAQSAFSSNMLVLNWRMRGCVSFPRNKALWRQTKNSEKSNPTIGFSSERTGCS
jgi:hypothetical protein